MKMSDGFTRIVPSVITGIGYIASAVFLALALRKLPLGGDLCHVDRLWDFGHNDTGDNVVQRNDHFSAGGLYRHDRYRDNRAQTSGIKAV